MTDAEVLAKARKAQVYWEAKGDPVLIGNRENAVFRINLPNGQSAALRLHRKNYQTLDYINGELIWTEALADLGFPCPKPIPTSHDEHIVHLEDGQMVTAISWIDAEPLAAFSGSITARADMYFGVGKMLAQLHSLTDQIPDKIQRPSWDQTALLGPDPSWGRFWENPSLNPHEVELVQSVRNDAAHVFADFDEQDFGLIHADAIQENVLVNDQMYLIDFDDGGYGHRLYELGVALVPDHDSPDLPQFMSAICEGYGTTTKHIPFFMMLRSMASAGWIVSRADPAAQANRRYADRMLRCIDLYQNS